MKDNLTLAKMIGIPQYQGPVMGVEIEVECQKAMPKYDGVTALAPHNWVAVKDGSLRGHSMEYVAHKPEFRKTIVEKMLPELKEHLSYNTVNHTSTRVSSHVHLNVGDMTYIQTVVLATLWWSVENFLVDWCGPSRVGNNFCLRIKDATRLVTNMINDIVFFKRSIRVGNPCIPYASHFSASDVKYSSLNLATACKIGTFEFRTFGGLNFEDMKPFEHWLEQIEYLRDLAVNKFKDPVEVWKYLDERGPDDLAKEVLTKYFYDQYLKLDATKRRRMITDNEMFIASIAFCISNWFQTKPMLKDRKAPKSKTPFVPEFLAHFASGPIPTDTWTAALQSEDGGQF